MNSPTKKQSSKKQINTIEQKVIYSSKHYWFPISLQITITAPLLLFPSSQFELSQTQTRMFILNF